MIDVPTLFILGTGASKPYDFPVGSELKEQIIKDFTVEIERLLQNSSSLHQREKNSVISDAKSFVNNFKKTPNESIDNYLATNPKYSHIGKMAITIFILLKERTSKFFDDKNKPDDKDDWYKLIFNRMLSQCNNPEGYKKFKENKIAFITFNYDRSLEYFLSRSFCHNFYESRDGFEFSLQEHIPFPIIHVYGQVAPFVWSSGPFLNNEIDDYRDYIMSYKAIEKLSEGIRVVGERTQEDLGAKIRDLFKHHERIFFCGFGYAEENLKAIGIPRNIDENSQVFGTAMGKNPNEIRDIKNIFPLHTSQVIHQPGDRIETFTDYAKIEDKNSYELLRNHL
jgi:hypothetical protein